MITNSYNQFIRDISDALRDLGYTDSTIGLRQHYWKQYYDYHGGFDIDESTMNNFLRELYCIKPDNINISKRQYEIRAALRNLLEFNDYGKIINYHTPWFKDMPWVDSFKPTIDAFMDMKKKEGLKTATIVNYERSLKRFTNYLESIDIHQFEDIQPQHITSFISDSIDVIARNLHSTLCHLRVFLRYTYLNGHNSKDLSLIIPKSNVLLKRRNIPNIWSSEDVKKILSCVDVANPVGKRDYAIILMVARLGIRVSDVIRLTFSDIKWNQNCIRFIQYKTGEPIVLPLFEDVGNAIIDYIKYGRPQCQLNNIFITHKPPFSKFSDNNHLYGMFNKYLVRSGIEVSPDKNHGLHTLRHSLATELLRKEIPLPVISEILGHKSLETTMKYLRIDVDHLRQCTLIEGENYAE